METLRIGCLGAARITPAALIKPAGEVAGVEAYAVAARDRGRAIAFAAKHRIPVVHDSYDEMLADPAVEAIYNPLPNGLHAEWTIKALEAGKHVLCEKPFTANAPEAERVAKVAAGTDLVLMEAFHWRYHPLAHRMVEVIRSGELGRLRRVEASLCFPLPFRKDIRWQLPLAGGALMDAGCYPVHMVRTLAGAAAGSLAGAPAGSLAGSEPTVRSATMRLRSPEIDRYVAAELDFPDGVSGRITASMWSSTVLSMHATVIGEKATMRVFNPTNPHMYHRFRVGDRREHIKGYTTYHHQLEAFLAAVRTGAPILTPPSDSIANMVVIDAIYRAAGLHPRPGGTD